MASPDPELVNRILIPFDFSETSELSMEHGLFMAKLVKAEILLLHIVEQVSFTTAISQALGGVEKKIESASIEKLQAYADQVHAKSGLTVTVRTEVGRVYRKINEVANEWKADLIIMGTHGAQGYQKFSLGTNTSRVVQESPCPVLSVQTHATGLGFKKIVLPIDESVESRQKVPFAVGIAQFYGAQIVLLGIINFSGEELVRRFKIKVEQVEDYVVNHGLDYETVYREGNDLAGITLRTSEELGADMLVIMTEQQPSITGFLLGTYATRVVNNSRIPVMSIHPTEVDPDKITVRF
ncbi:MAG: universal stress protein [Bacteroidota bacterium]|jgi:nucleotide-binding universal stress UspA family protein